MKQSGWRPGNLLTSGKLWRIINSLNSAEPSFLRSMAQSIKTVGCKRLRNRSCFQAALAARPADDCGEFASRIGCSGCAILASRSRFGTMRKIAPVIAKPRKTRCRLVGIRIQFCTRLPLTASMADRRIVLRSTGGSRAANRSHPRGGAASGNQVLATARGSDKGYDARFALQPKRTECAQGTAYAPAMPTANSL